MKKSLIIICIAILAVTVVAAGCGKSTDAYQRTLDRIDSSMQSVKEVQAVLTVTDQEVKVYDYRRTVTVYSADSVMVNTTEQKLSSNFTWETTTDSESLDSLDRAKIMGLDLSRANVGEVKTEGDAVNITIPAASLSAVLGQDVSADGDGVLVLTFDGQKLTSASLDVTTDGGRKVAVKATYLYE